MTYGRAELDWIEAEWAFHLHGRSAFLSREDFNQLMAWDQEGVPAEVVINAFEAYFGRRAKRARPRSFVALSHVARDVAKAMKLRASLVRAGEALAPVHGWEGVRPLLGQDPKARQAFEIWGRLKAGAPDPDSPGFLDHFDQERQAFRSLVALAETALGPGSAALQEQLRERLQASKLEPDSLVWRKAWDHHWARLVCEAWGIPQ